MFLEPDQQVVQLCEYVLAVGCARYEIQPIAGVALSNHLQLVAHDPCGRWPELAVIRPPGGAHSPGWPPSAETTPAPW